MDNYVLAQDRARQAFLRRNHDGFATRPGISGNTEEITFRFLGTKTTVGLKTGEIAFQWENKIWKADYSEAFSVYDWLCDSKPQATASGEFCPAHGLPGVYVAGSGLSMSPKCLAEAADQEPGLFSRACEALGGRRLYLGDMAYEIPVVPGLTMVLKFYHRDEEFPPSMTILWDKNTLEFVRYETIYYIAGALCQRLELAMSCL